MITHFCHSEFVSCVSFVAWSVSTKHALSSWGTLPSHKAARLPPPTYQDRRHQSCSLREASCRPHCVCGWLSPSASPPPCCRPLPPLPACVVLFSIFSSFVFIAHGSVSQAHFHPSRNLFSSSPFLLSLPTPLNPCVPLDSCFYFRALYMYVILCLS